MTDLLTIAEAQIAEKQVKEIQAVKERLEADREVLKKAIELVNSHTLYKVVSDGYNRTRYQLATEEMLKEDYLKDGESSYYGSGIRFLDKGNIRNYNTGLLRVNGETYYDIRYALDNYEYRLRDELPPPMLSEMVSTILFGIVRHVHCATTPSGKTLRHT